LGGLDEFDPVQFEPVVLTDAKGETHEFHFRTRLFGTGVALDAFELRDGYPAGYRFQVIGSNSRKQLNILISHSFLSELFVRKMSIKTVP
jgi:hypothetical protein